MRTKTMRMLIGMSLAIALAACGGGEGEGADVATDGSATGESPAEAAEGAETGAAPETGGEGGAETEAQSDYSFEGQEIRFVSPFPPGGQADIRARLAAANFAEFAPGNPRVVVENLTGGGGAVAMATVMEGDPEQPVIVVPTVGVALRWLLQEEGHDYPLQDAQFVGAMPGSLAFLTPVGEVSSLSDLAEADEPWVIGDNAPNNAPGLANELIARMVDMPYQHVFGFEGEGPLAIAVERGEVDVVSVGDAAWRQTYQPLGVVEALFDHGLMSSDGEIVASELLAEAGLPTFGELYEEELGEAPEGPLWEAFRAIAGLQSNDTPLIVHPDMPQDMVAALRAAWTAMTEDPSWGELSQERLGAPQPAITGEEAQAIWSEASNPSEDALQTLQEVSGG